MDYPHKLTVRDIPVPDGAIQVVIESDLGAYKTTKEYFATPEEFLSFWKPLVKHYESVENAIRTEN
jgi:3-hydroxy-3-methylglutaryl CoA synthase